jgi:radical SAM-linked protein
MIDCGREGLLEILKRTAAPPQMRRSGQLASLNVQAIEEGYRAFSARYASLQTIRLVLTKTGPLKYISHNDYLEVIRRGLRMAEAPLSFTQGFNKRERLSMGYPVPLGIESLAELCDVELYEQREPSLLCDRLDSVLPEGIRAVAARTVSRGTSLMAETHAVEYAVLFRDSQSAQRCLDALGKGVEITDSKKRVLSCHEIVSAYALLSADELERIQSLCAHGEAAVNGIKLTILIGPPTLRADLLVMALLGCEHRDLYRIALVKCGQYSTESNGYAP